jgi:hypothetical protein
MRTSTKKFHVRKSRAGSVSLSVGPRMRRQFKGGRSKRVALRVTVAGETPFTSKKLVKVPSIK